MRHAFPCDNAALDFVGTLRARRATEPLDLLTTPEDLDSWLRESGVVDRDPHCLRSDVATAVALREAIYSLVAARLVHQEYDGDALALVNQAARTPCAVVLLTPAGRHVEATPAQAMSSVARVAVDVLGGPEAHLLKECERPGCTQVFLDRSRGFRREWCAMQTCGNRVKGATYRARRRGNLAPTAVPRARRSQ